MPLQNLFITLQAFSNLYGIYTYINILDNEDTR